MKKFIIIAAVAAVAVLGTATTALAANASPTSQLTDSLTITAGVNSKIVVTAGADKAWGWLEPDSGDNQYVQNVNVRSNCQFTLGESTPSDNFPAGIFFVNGDDLSGTFAAAPAVGGVNFSRTYHVNLDNSADWAAATAAGDSYSATVLYTAVAQ